MDYVVQKTKTINFREQQNFSICGQNADDKTSFVDHISLGPHIGFMGHKMHSTCITLQSLCATMNLYSELQRDRVNIFNNKVCPHFNLFKVPADLFCCQDVLNSWHLLYCKMTKTEKSIELDHCAHRHISMVNSLDRNESIKYNYFFFYRQNCEVQYSDTVHSDTIIGVTIAVH